MLDQTTLADLEGAAIEMYQLAGLDPDEAPGVWRLCRALTGRVPGEAPIRTEGCLSLVKGRWLVYVREGLRPERATFIAAHELGHLYHRRIGYVGVDIEERCNALGAMLACPRQAFQAAVSYAGRHTVSKLAEAFNVTSGVTLLRLGEVFGRPVVLLSPKPIARGAPFGWPPPDRLRTAVFRPPPGIHPVRLRDEQRWGLMAA